MCLLKAFIRNGFCPSVIRKGRKILVMEIKVLGVRFITSNLYFNGDEYDVANQYEIKFNRCFFPLDFIQIQNFDYEGLLPDLKYFFSALDNEIIKKEKEDYCNLLTIQNYKWNFQKELTTFCEQKLWLLTLSSLIFIKDCLSLQDNFEKIYKFPLENKLNPFSYPLCSLSGYTYKLYRALFLNHYDIHVINNEFGIKTKNVSKVENEWANFMDFKYPEKIFQSAFNNPEGQKYFKEAIPDLYSPISKEALFFNGCVFHGHYENCSINPNASELTRTPFGKTYKEVNDEFLSKLSYLLINNPLEIAEIAFRWECDYKQLRETNTELKDFLLSKYFPHPLYRLQPRTCVRGAYFDVCALLWSSSKFPLETLHFLDVNGLYSYCSINFPFMVGKYVTLIGKSLEKLSQNNNCFFYNSKRIMGSMLVTILPPENLYFPFLLYRTSSGKSVNTLCRTCSERKIEKCNHSELDRALTSSYMISEIEFALSLNYKLLAIHECHVYEESAFILKDFVSHLNYFKLRSSNCLENSKTLSEKFQYCEQLNNDMNLKEPFNLTPFNIKANPQKRQFYKVMANALFGKLEQRNDKASTIFVNQQSDLEKLYFSANEILDVNCINNEICEVQISSKLKTKIPNKNSNCYLGAQLTAYARQTIYSYLQLLQRSKATVYQVDCDSIIFSLGKEKLVPLPISDAVGHFKYEITNIQSYQSLGPKNYCITFEKDGKIETVTKVRGLSLNNSLNENTFSEELFKNYVQQFLKNQKRTILVNQFRRKGDFKRFKISSSLEQISFSNALSERRLIDKNSTILCSYPYGFKK